MEPSSSTPYQPQVTHRYKLKVLQQPSKARLCSFREKVDRRPIDPPPIVQLYCTCHRQQRSSPQQLECYHYTLHNPYFFLYANLTSITDDTDLCIHHGHRTTAGAVVQSLHKLKGPDNNDGGFFVFADISVRLEGNYRLKFTLFEILGEHVRKLESVISDPFTVYSPKYFPGMSESSLLTRLFSDQGVRIRIRKDTRMST
ncbi:velvet factor [Chlamydoabsidia padenii]|nr:velvet factor [Chlamydoabsidia padenii]